MAPRLRTAHTADLEPAELRAEETTLKKFGFVPQSFDLKKNTIDLLTERFAAQRDASPLHAQVHDDWVIVTRYSRPRPERFDRDITVFRRVDDAWRRTDEHHRNVLFEADRAIAILREEGVDASVRPAFGEETLPEGLVVLAGVRR